MPVEHPHDPQLSTRRKVMMTVLVVVLLCAAVEGASRLVWWRLERTSLRAHYQRGEVILNNDAINFMKVPDGVYGYKMKPGFRNDNNTINSQGFRQSADVLLRRSPGSLRIVCLGESTTIGSDDVSNYPRLLQQILESSAVGYRSYEVINAGVPGWISDQIALRVHREIAAFTPDVAILYVGWNDFQAYDALGPIPAESSFAESYGRSTWMEYANSASRTVALLSALAEHHGADPSAPPFSGRPADGNPPDLRYRFLLANLHTIVRDLRAANPSVRIVVCTLVGLWPQGSPEAWAKMASPGWVKQHHLTPPQAARFVDELNQQLRQFAAANGCVLVDTAAIFDSLDRTRLQWDFAHMYKDGYELMAWAMFDALRSSGIVTANASDRHQALLSAYRKPSA
jgi:lysophospholipase L1-like esterase